MDVYLTTQVHIAGLRPTPKGSGMTKIGIILGSTRPGRNGEAVARWVLDVARQRDDAEFDLIDLLDYRLPHLDEAIPPSLGQYTQPHTQEWARTIDAFDGFVM